MTAMLFSIKTAADDDDDDDDDKDEILFDDDRMNAVIIEINTESFERRFVIVFCFIRIFNPIRLRFSLMLIT